MNHKEHIEFLKSQEKDLLIKREDIDRTLKSIQNTIQHIISNGVIHPTAVPQLSTVILGYDENVTWNEKLLTVLGVIEKGTVRDMVTIVKVNEPDTDEDLILKRLTITASTLNKEKNSPIKVVGKIGKAFKYTLKKPEQN